MPIVFMVVAGVIVIGLVATGLNRITRLIGEKGFYKINDALGLLFIAGFLLGAIVFTSGN